MKIRALLAGLLCAMGLVFLTGCGDSPEKAFKEIKDGFVKGDAAKVMSRVADEDLRKDTAGLDSLLKDPKIREAWKNTEIVSSTVNGDTAVVKVKAKIDGKVKEGEFKLVKVDGKWKMKK